MEILDYIKQITTAIGNMHKDLLQKRCNDLGITYDDEFVVTNADVVKQLIFDKKLNLIGDDIYLTAYYISENHLMVTYHHLSKCFTVDISDKETIRKAIQNYMKHGADDKFTQLIETIDSPH